MNNPTASCVNSSGKNLKKEFMTDEHLCSEFKAMLRSQGISMDTFHGILLNSDDPKKVFQRFHDQFEFFLRQESVTEDTGEDGDPSDHNALFSYVEGKSEKTSSPNLFDSVSQSSWGETDIFDYISDEEVA